MDTPNQPKPALGSLMIWGRLTEGTSYSVPTLKGQQINSISGTASGIVGLTDKFQLHAAPDPDVLNFAVAEVAREHNVIQVALGSGGHGLMCTQDGQVFAWGAGAVGQIGNGRALNCEEPELITRLDNYNIVRVAAGEEHCMALADDGSLFSWGRNYEGQCGVGFKSPKAIARAGSIGIQLAPKFVYALNGNPVARVACGARFTAVVTQQGQVWTWGEGGCGQLGIGRVTKADRPQLAIEAGLDGAPFTDVACGWAHCLALTESGHVYAWGLNCKGQLGLGDITTRHHPTQIVRPDADTGLIPAADRVSKQVARPMFELCGRDPCNPDNRRPPPLLHADIDCRWTLPSEQLIATHISAGSYHSAAITRQGRLYTWGSAAHGQLGLALEPSIGIIAAPTLVESLGERKAVAVFCGVNDTAIVAGARLERIQPAIGSTVGGTHVRLSGPGLGALAYRDEEAARAGQAVAGLMIRFCRPAQKADDESEPADAASESAEMKEHVKLVPAFWANDDELYCTAPAFPSPCDVQVTVLVEDSQVEGSAEFGYYAPASLRGTSVSNIHLLKSNTLQLHGDGWFGCMLADVNWRPFAESFMNAVEESRQGSWKPPASPLPDSPLVAKCTLMMNGTPAESVLIPAWYSPYYEEPHKSDEEDDQDEEGMFCAAISVQLPPFDMSTALSAALDSPAMSALGVSLTVSTNGVDFSNSLNVSGTCAGVTSLWPDSGGVRSSTMIRISGRGFSSMSNPVVTFVSGAQTVTAPGTIVDSKTISTTLPALSLGNAPSKAGMRPATAAFTKQHFSVSLSLDGSSTVEGPPLSFLAYNAKFVKVTPQMVPVCGGPEMTLEATGDFLFPTSSAVIYLSGNGVERQVPATVNPEQNKIKFRMPALADRSDSKAEPFSGQPIRLPLAEPKMAVDVSLNGIEIIKGGMHVLLFDECGLQVTDVAPVKGKVGETLTVSGTGWSHVPADTIATLAIQQGSNAEVKVSSTSMNHDTKAFSFVIPAEFTPGPISFKLSLDGCHWTQMAQTFTVLK